MLLNRFPSFKFIFRTSLIMVGFLTSHFVAAEPFSIENNHLFYDTINSEGAPEIDWEHEKELLNILKDNTAIDTIILNSDGGYIGAANAMADLVIDAGLNTFVEGTCASACVTIFLAGKNRTLELGGKIGFHAGWWSAEDLKEYYEEEKEAEGWASPFEFASWLYEDTQAEIFKEFEYLLERGVKPNFAIQTLKAGADGMWYPRRKQLLDGGILTE